jgi:hypothetical protein
LHDGARQPPLGQALRPLRFHLPRRERDINSRHQRSKKALPLQRNHTVRSCSIKPVPVRPVHAWQDNRDGRESVAPSVPAERSHEFSRVQISQKPSDDHNVVRLSAQRPQHPIDTVLIVHAVAPGRPMPSPSPLREQAPCPPEAPAVRHALVPQPHCPPRPPFPA